MVIFWVKISRWRRMSKESQCNLERLNRCARKARQPKWSQHESSWKTLRRDAVLEIEQSCHMVQSGQLENWSPALYWQHNCTFSQQRRWAMSELGHSWLEISRRRFVWRRKRRWCHNYYCLTWLHTVNTPPTSPIYNECQTQSSGVLTLPWKRAH